MESKGMVYYGKYNNIDNTENWEFLVSVNFPFIIDLSL